MKKNISLVLEGGGLRGAYSAGCLSWLIDNNINFKGNYGISTGALHLTAFLLKDKDFLFNSSTDYLVDKRVIGLKSFLSEGHIVSYDYLMNSFIEKGFNIDKLKDYKDIAKVGLYDLSRGETIYKDIQKMNMNELKAACSLPILGKIVKDGDHEYLDGGITKMIPIEEAINDKLNKHLIIATKPIDYVRKKANWFVSFLIGLIYHKCPSIKKDYKIRHLNYQKQIGLIKDLVAKEEAIYICPSQKTNVTRLGGSKEELEALFNLGYQDMENKKEAILKLLKG